MILQPLPSIYDELMLANNCKDLETSRPSFSHQLLRTIKSFHFSGFWMGCVVFLGLGSSSTTFSPILY